MTGDLKGAGVWSLRTYRIFHMACLFGVLDQNCANNACKNFLTFKILPCASLGNKDVGFYHHIHQGRTMLPTEWCHQVCKYIRMNK